MYGGAYVAIMIFFGLSAGAIGRIKGSSFFLWFLIGFCLPVIGTLAALRGAGTATSRAGAARSAAPSSHCTTRSASAAGATSSGRTRS